MNTNHLSVVEKIHVLLAQIKPKKADYAHNLNRVADLFSTIHEQKLTVDVLCLPETAMSGYFLEGGVREAAVAPETLFADLQAAYRERLSGRSGMPPLDIALGFYESHQGKLYNSAMYATLGDHPESGIRHVHRKFFLPSYGVFDEKRFVARGRNFEAFPTRFGVPVAVAICEDLWHSISGTILALKGAQVIFTLSASPGRGFEGDIADNARRWRQLLVNVAEEHGVWVTNTGLVGFEGGKGFVGVSTVIDPFGKSRVEGPLGDEALILGEISLDDIAIARASAPLLSDLESSLADIVQELAEAEQSQHRGSWNS